MDRSPIHNRANIDRKYFKTKGDLVSKLPNLHVLDYGRTLETTNTYQYKGMQEIRLITVCVWTFWLWAIHTVDL